MSFITVTEKGSFRNTESYLKRSRPERLTAILHKYGNLGVQALANATPIESGLTAESWYYEVVERTGYHSIRWFNSNRQNGSNIAILLQYGHATKNGGYVQGRDYVNPAIRPIFDKIALEMEREVMK